MTIEELKIAYRNQKSVKEISQHLSQGKLHAFISGLAGSSGAFITHAVFENAGETHLALLNDKEEAVYFFNDLENISQNENTVMFFPASHRLPYTIEETENANILMRAEVLNRLNKDKRPVIIVTYPEALAEKVVTQQHLEKNTLEIKQGSSYSIDFIDEVLLEYEFEKTDFVYRPGQFSIRGGIIDIFSFSHEDPYRVEFFGDEAESIRTFDTITQLSKQNMGKINIVPNVQEKLLREQRQSFFDYISPKSVLWIQSLAACRMKIEKEIEKAKTAYTHLHSVIEQLPPEELYIDTHHFTEKINSFSVIETGIVPETENITEIKFNTTPQPAFNKNFDLLAKDLQLHSRQNYTNLILADNPKQVERLNSIFADKQKEVHLTPIHLSIHEGFIDHDNKIACYTDHQVFERYHRFKLKEGFNKTKEALTLKDLLSLQKGDYITHIDHGIGQYSGLEKINVNGKEQEAIRLIYKGGDVVYISIHSLHRISKYSGKEGTEPVLNKLGTNAWATLKQKTKKRIKEIAYDLIKLYAQRKTQKGFQFSPDNYLQTELEASFIYEDTPDQLKATIAVKKDMEESFPMDRLICGDVGFGKTEIAMRAAFKSVCDSKQVAILCPTTILSLQHYKSFSERFKDFPCRVDYVNRFKSSKKIKDTLEKVKNGEVDILIGTHRLVAKDVHFKDLGLLVIDEEQKFGVSVKDKLKLMKANVDTLTLTATPIPRTLQFSLMGARDLSIISTPPPNRHPVQTEIRTFSEELVRDKIMYEVSRGGQVFFVHNRVQNIQEIAGMIQRVCPGMRVAVGHGQMDGDKLEEVMVDFIEGMYDVLVATAIIESGIDIPNANTIIINDAHNFGLSDLHQLRGRVGRSNKRAFCVLLTQPLHLLPDDSRKRLQAIEQFSELGSGFSIAMRDLDIRGAGNLLGAEQSGFINEIGYETYQKILDEAITELKENEFKELYHPEQDEHYEWSHDCVIETDLEILIPDNYVNLVNERLILYRELDELKDENELLQFRNKLTDRFGKIPEQTEELLDTIRLRWKARETGIEKIFLKNGKMTCYFISKEKSPFYQSPKFTRVLNFIKENHRIANMEEKNGKLQMTFKEVKDVRAAIFLLDLILKTTVQ
ncbi:MAG: transcription-repair coupling factor [Bacteroidota bacterium]